MTKAYMTFPRHLIAELLEYGSCKLHDVEFEHLIGTTDAEKRIERMLSAVGFWLRSYDANLDTCADAALDQIEACVRENRQ